MMSFLFACLFLTSLAYAEETLQDINVTATKDVDRFTFANSGKITEEDLKNVPVGLLAPALEKIPGIVANQNGGPGGRVSFFIRGTESRHVSFTLDGMKINDTSNTDRQFDAAFMTSPFIKEVIVHKGPQAVLFGSDAIGGMVELKTRKGEHAPQTRLSVNAGSFATLDTSLSNDWKKTDSKGTLTVSRFHTDGISRLNRKRFNGKEADSTDTTQLTSSSEHRWAKRFQTDLLASYLHGRAEQDGFNSDNNFDFSRNDQYLLQQKTNFDLGSTQALSLRNGFNRHQRHNDSLSSGKEFFNGNLLQNELLHRFESNHFGLLSGLGTDHESATAIGMDRSFDLHSFYTQGAFDHGPWKLHAGLRADRHSRYGSFYTGSGGIGFYDLSIQYSQGYKAPSLYQLYGPDSFGAPVGNPNLVPETNHSLEASWKKKTDNVETNFTVFQNRLSNQFTYSFTKGYINQQKFIAEGIEASTKINLQRAVISGSMTHQNFRHEESPVLRRPTNMVQGSFSYFIEETVELNVTERWNSARKDFDKNGDVTKLNSFEVTDISVRKFWEKDEVAIQIKNVLNRKYEELYGFNVMPFSIFLHYGHTF